MSSAVPSTIGCAADGCEHGRVEVAFCPHSRADQPAYRFKDCDECAGTGEVEAEWNHHQAAHLEERERLLRLAQAGERRLREQLVDAQASEALWKRRAEEAERARARSALHPQILAAVVLELRALKRLGNVRVPVSSVDRNGRVTRAERDLAAIGEDALHVIEALRAGLSDVGEIDGRPSESEVAA